MNITQQSAPRALFRDRQAAAANTSVLIWVSFSWLVSIAFMGAHLPIFNVLGVLLCTHAMVLAAYLIHEAAHQSLFAEQWANYAAGEAMNFIAGSPYASFERIRHMHIRHHVDRADLTCFDFKGLLQRRPALRRALGTFEVLSAGHRDFDAPTGNLAALRALATPPSAARARDAAAALWITLHRVQPAPLILSLTQLKAIDTNG